MSELSNTQFFQVGNAPQIQAKEILEIVYSSARKRVQSGESDCWLYYVWRSYLYYEP